MKENENNKPMQGSESGAEELFRVLMDTMLDGVIIIDWLGNLLFANNATFKLMELDKRPEEITSLNIRTFVHPDSLLKAFADLALVRVGKGGFVSEYKIITAEKNIKWFECTKQLVHFKGKTADLITMRDVTERRKLEENIKASEEKYRTIFDSSPDTIVLFDRESRIISLNKRIKDLVGYDVSEIVGLKLGEVPFITKDVARLITDNFSNRIRGVIVAEYETELIHKNSSKVRVQVTGTVVRKDGEVVGTLATLTDITEKRNLQSTLRESEERYRKSQTVGHVGNWEFNIKKAEIWGSDEAKRVFGFAPNTQAFTLEEVEGCVPERERVHQALVDLVEKGKEYNLEYDIITRDKKERKTIASIAELEKDADGKPLRITGVIIDITSRKEMEEALKENENKYRSIFDNSPETIVLIDKRGVLLDINKKVLETVGYRKEEVIGKNILDLPYITPEGKKVIAENFAKRLKGETVAPYEVKFVSKQGEEIYGILSGTSLADERGFSGAIIIISDITRENKLQKNLEDSEEKYRILSENANEMILVAQDGMLKYFNPKAIRVVGYPSEEVAKKQFIDFVHPDDRKMVASNYIKRLKGEKVPENYSFRIITKKGDTIWVVLNSVKIEWEGKPATLNFLTDITELHKSSEELKKRLADFEIYSKMTTERELKMIELKKEIDELLKRTGKPPKYGNI